MVTGQSQFQYLLKVEEMENIRKIFIKRYIEFSKRECTHTCELVKQRVTRYVRNYVNLLDT